MLKNTRFQKKSEFSYFLPYNSYLRRLELSNFSTSFLNWLNFGLRDLSFTAPMLGSAYTPILDDILVFVAAK